MNRKGDEDTTDKKTRMKILQHVPGQPLQHQPKQQCLSAQKLDPATLPAWYRVRRTIPGLHVLALHSLVPMRPTFVVRPVIVHLVLVRLTESAQVHALYNAT